MWGLSNMANLIKIILTFFLILFPFFNRQSSLSAGGGTGANASNVVQVQTTWYIRHDGGDRYSANKTAGLCDGQADAVPVGTTPNQHCAFNDVRYLWADFSYNASATFPGWGWVIAGGDTVIIKDCIQYAAHAITGTPGSSGPCRIGW